MAWPLAQRPFTAWLPRRGRVRAAASAFALQ
jgi:hypothetical protein